ncbi:hypothetical protein VPH35_124821 [Triticum aestivum]
MRDGRRLARHGGGPANEEGRDGVAAVHGGAARHQGRPGGGAAQDQRRLHRLPRHRAQHLLSHAVGAAAALRGPDVPALTRIELMASPLPAEPVKCEKWTRECLNSGRPHLCRLNLTSCSLASFLQPTISPSGWLSASHG